VRELRKMITKLFIGNTNPRVQGGNLWKEWRVVFINGRMGGYYLECIFEDFNMRL
jgi:hypothetical protein